MGKLTKEHWELLKKIGINKELVEERACGIWFKNIGCEWAVGNDKKRQLIELNTLIQSTPQKDKRV